MAPTKIYVKSILNLLEKIQINGIAHITGGGIYENIPRILKDNQKALIKKESWTIPSIFNWLKKKANIDDIELFKTFNCGIGLVIAISPVDEEMALGTLNQSDFFAKNDIYY